MRSLYFLAPLLLFFSMWSHLHGEETRKIKLLPVQHEGRIKPLDSVARSALLQLHGSQNLHYQGRRITATAWLLEVLMNSKAADAIPLIRVENLDVLALLGKHSRKMHYFSLNELQPFLKKILHLSEQALSIPNKKLDNFQKSIIVLEKQIIIYLRLSNTFWIAKIENASQEFLDFKQTIFEKNDTLKWYAQRYAYLSEAASFNILPPLSKNDAVWLSMGKGLLQKMRNHSEIPSIATYIDMISSYQNNDSRKFNIIVEKHINNVFSIFSNLKIKINLEVFYNSLQPFFTSLVIYFFVFMFSIISLIVKTYKLKVIAFILFILGFSIHTLGLVARIMIAGYAPVTNLYSSAVFVGWGAVFFSLIMHCKLRNSPFCIIGSIMGFLTLIIAQHFTGDGDTIEVMRAVLNSNFWLSTHVVTITLGYSATFLAGSLGAVYILGGIFTQSLDKKSSDELTRIVYRIVCFSTLLSFSGTVLGGFWADKSWGRFWGWDPKEIGALLVILWNVLILHARAGKCINSRGLMIMAVIGNNITAFSWFGVNLLGIGLHSYGFTEGTFIYLILFALSQLGIAFLGMIPKHWWRSSSIFSRVKGEDTDLDDIPKNEYHQQHKIKGETYG